MNEGAKNPSKHACQEELSCAEDDEGDLDPSAHDDGSSEEYHGMFEIPEEVRRRMGDLAMRAETVALYAQLYQYHGLQSLRPLPIS